MLKTVRLIFIIILFFIGPLLFSSAYENLQYPPGIKWFQIDTVHFAIVFPENLKKIAKNTAEYFENIYPSISLSKKNRVEKFTIFLNNFGNISNGYIQLAPKKGEFFLTPPQSMFMGNIDWLNGLAIHEGRHTAQFSFFNRGFTKFSGLIFGEFGRSLFSFLSVPQWFWEGDAVYSETILSKGGRGRVASFNVGLRTLLLNNKIYSYSKAYLSSYKDYIPNIYKLGFFITTYIRNNYPKNTWKRMLDHSSKYSYYPFIFSSSLKRTVGKGIKRIYRDSMEDISTFWKEKFKKISPTTFKTISPKRKEWTYYSSPKSDDNGNLISQKYTLSRPLSIVRINPDKTEKNIFQINPIEGTKNNISVKNQNIVWSEIRPDIRWGKKDYSEIVLFNVKSRCKKRITKKTRFFSPVFSPDGLTIAAVNVKQDSQCRIVILNSKTGNILKHFSPGDRSFIASPNWSEDGKKIVVILQKSGKKSISIINTDNQTFSTVLPYSFENYNHPLIYKNHVIYGSDIDGIDNIYSVNIETGEKFRITSALYGAYFPEIDKKNKKLIYCNYDINGTAIVSSDLSPSEWEPIKTVPSKKYYFENFNKSRLNKNEFSSGKTVTFIPKIKKYNKFKDLINFHSRFFDPTMPEPGLYFLSDNKLNTFSLITAFKFNTNEKRPVFLLQGTYSALFPKIHFSFSKTGRSSGYPHYYRWNENEFKTGIEIPLNLSSGTHLRKLSLNTNISFIHIADQHSNNLIENGYLSSLSYGFNYSSFKLSARRDIIPQKGHFFYSLFRHTPFGGKYRGEIFSVYSGIIIPGFFQNNQLLFKAAYEHQNPLNYIFSSQISFPRGYNYDFYKSFSYISLDYIFPIAYPDFSIGSLMYIKRLRGDIFTDFGIGSDTNFIKKSIFNSAGIELKIDFNLFSIPAEIYGGVRLSYLFGKDTFSITPLFFEIGF